jgi:hypothetical protein
VSSDSGTARSNNGDWPMRPCPLHDSFCQPRSHLAALPSPPLRSLM